MKSESTEKNDVNLLIDRQRAIIKEEKQKQENIAMEKDAYTDKSQQDRTNIMPREKTIPAEIKETNDPPILAEDPEKLSMGEGKDLCIAKVLHALGILTNFLLHVGSKKVSKQERNFATHDKTVVSYLIEY